LLLGSETEEDGTKHEDNMAEKKNEMPEGITDGEVEKDLTQRTQRKSTEGTEGSAARHGRRALRVRRGN
jgi:hypothetical protein